MIDRRDPDFERRLTRGAAKDYDSFDVGANLRQMEVTAKRTGSAAVGRAWHGRMT
jgi:hypothetical protein